VGQHPRKCVRSDKLDAAAVERDGLPRRRFKDVRLMLSTAAQAGTKLDVGELVERNLSMGVDAGKGEQDWSSIHEIARKKAGLD
jgi:3-hydroxyisobutyrate dehydrogenase-like beta-hydroxyacid dehydrogenase